MTSKYLKIGGITVRGPLGDLVHNVSPFEKPPVDFFVCFLFLKISASGLDDKPCLFSILKIQFDSSSVSL